MSEKHSKVRWGRILKNYREAYNYNDEWEIAVIELIANSIDAGASEIRIKIGNNIFNKTYLICQDNGKGMNEEEFEEYHNLGSLTKDRGQTIGFAGIGAKLMLDLCDEVYTETKKNGKILASLWYYKRNEDEPYYKYVIPQNKLIYENGTYVKIKGLKVTNLTTDILRDIIYSNYQYILNKIKIYINNIELENPIPILKKYSLKNKHLSKKSPRGNLSYTGMIFYFDENGLENIRKYYGEKLRAPNAFKHWFDIVVYGKTVKREVHFNLINNIKHAKWDKITGFVQCDELINILKVSKDDLNTRPGVWTSFSNMVKKDIANWLYKIGVYEEINEIEEKKPFNKIIERLEKDINLILKNNPEILERLMPGKPLSGSKEGEIPPAVTEIDKNKESVFVQDPTGKPIATISEGGEIGRGTLGGEGSSEGPNVPHTGDDKDIYAPHEPINEENNSLTPVVRKHIPRRRYKIGISWAPLHNEKPVEWFPEQNTFVINDEHPAAVFAIESGIETVAFYTLHMIINYIAENYIDDENTHRAVWNLYENVLNYYKGDDNET